MADNLGYTEGAGKKVGSAEVSDGVETVHFQKFAAGKTFDNAQTLDFSTSDTIVVDVKAARECAMQFFDSFTGTAIFEGSIGEEGGDKHWFPLQGRDVNNDPVLSFTAAGIFFFDTGLLKEIRVSVSVTGTGTAGSLISILY